MRSMRRACALSACAVLAGMVAPTGVGAHPGQQHGPLTGHLSGKGTWGDSSSCPSCG